MKLSIIIPVFNEENSLEEIVNHVFAVDLGEIEKEIIISNDGSQDQTYDIIKKFHLKYPKLISHHSSTNLGIGAAVSLAIAISSGDMITVQDADLELNPNDCPRLLTPPLIHETKIVHGSRFLNSKVKLKRTSRMAKGFFNFSYQSPLWLPFCRYGNSV